MLNKNVPVLAILPGKQMPIIFNTKLYENLPVLVHGLRFRRVCAV